MLKKTITYKDFDGNERTEDFYFNLTEAELTEMQYSAEGGLQEKLQRIVKAQDKGALIRVFKEIILAAYGEKSDDGKHFRKSKEISDSFTATPAYSMLFMELATNEEAASNFVNGIVPASARENKG